MYSDPCVAMLNVCGVIVAEGYCYLDWKLEMSMAIASIRAAVHRPLTSSKLQVLALVMGRAKNKKTSAAPVAAQQPPSQLPPTATPATTTVAFVDAAATAPERAAAPTDTAAAAIYGHASDALVQPSPPPPPPISAPPDAPPLAAAAAAATATSTAVGEAATTPNDANDDDDGSNGVVLDVLQPYLSLLPALRGVPLERQRLLHEALYSAGCTAAAALESYLRNKSTTAAPTTTPRPTPAAVAAADTPATTANVAVDAAAAAAIADAQQQQSESEELSLLLNYVSASDNLRRACQTADGRLLLRDAAGNSRNEVAAAALSAFAYAASRRPSTRRVEVCYRQFDTSMITHILCLQHLMNPTASVDVPEDTNSQTSQLTGVVVNEAREAALAALVRHFDHHF